MAILQSNTCISTGGSALLLLSYDTATKTYGWTSNQKITINGVLLPKNKRVPLWTEFTDEVDIKIYTGATKGQEKILLGAPWNGNNQITAEFREVFLRRNQDTVVETATLPESTV